MDAGDGTGSRTSGGSTSCGTTTTPSLDPPGSHVGALPGSAVGKPRRRRSTGTGTPKKRRKDKRRGSSTGRASGGGGRRRRSLDDGAVGGSNTPSGASSADARANYYGYSVSESSGLDYHNAEASPTTEADRLYASEPNSLNFEAPPLHNARDEYNENRSLQSGEYESDESDYDLVFDAVRHGDGGQRRYEANYLCLREIEEEGKVGEEEEPPPVQAPPMHRELPKSIELHLFLFA